MPGFSGEAALEIVRTWDADLPIIIVSGAIGEETAVDLMRGGASDFVLKQNLARLPLAVGRELRQAESRRLSEDWLRSSNPRRMRSLQQRRRESSRIGTPLPWRFTAGPNPKSSGSRSRF